MLRTHLYTFSTEPHPFQESLEQQLQEHGHHLVEAQDAQIILCMGQELQGFDEIGLQQIEQQILERFLGAELFIQARAFPFARIRVGYNEHRQLIVASPVDESTLFRIIRLLEQFKRIQPERYEDKIGALPFPIPDTTEKSSSPVFAPVQAEEPDTTAPVSETADTNPVTVESPRGIELSQVAAETEPLSATATWEEKLAHWQLTLTEDSFVMPPELSHGGIQHVLQSAPVHKSVQDGYGRSMGLFGFPDLLRPTSKVLLVTSDGGCIALHRRGQHAILSPIVEDLLFTGDGKLPQWIEPLLKDHSPLALEATKAYGQMHGEAISCSQQRPQHKSEGKVYSTIASLLLHWSSR